MIWFLGEPGDSDLHCEGCAAPGMSWPHHAGHCEGLSWMHLTRKPPPAHQCSESKLWRPGLSHVKPLGERK